MKYKKLGKSGINVSEIGFGAWTIALNWWGKEIDEDEMLNCYGTFATIDLNGKQIDGATDDVLPMGCIKSKFEAFDWTVIEIENGNDIESVTKGMGIAKASTGKGKPVCVLLKTMMGNGVDFMMHTHAWHGKAPNDTQLENALNQNPETLGDY